MNHRSYIKAGALGASGAVVIFIAFALLFSRSLKGWDRVHPGMTRTEVLRLMGKPQHSGWPENKVETWQTSEFVCHRRLALVYSNETVESICEGVWIRGHGWWRPRIESR